MVFPHCKYGCFPLIYKSAEERPKLHYKTIFFPQLSITHTDTSLYQRPPESEHFFHNKNTLLDRLVYLFHALTHVCFVPVCARPGGGEGPGDEEGGEGGRGLGQVQPHQHQVQGHGRPDGRLNNTEQGPIWPQDAREGGTVMASLVNRCIWPNSFGLISLSQYFHVA